MTSTEDVRVARQLLGSDGPTHADCRDLPGADLCPHLLSANGGEGDGTGVSDWRTSPYRHHAYTPDPLQGLARDDPLSSHYCRCGNSKINLLHLGCVALTCDQCGRNDGTHRIDLGLLHLRRCRACDDGVLTITHPNRCKACEAEGR